MRATGSKTRIASPALAVAIAIGSAPSARAHHPHPSDASNQWLR